MADLPNSETESKFFIQDSNGKVVVHSNLNEAFPKSSRMVEVRRSTSKRSISTSISTQVDESDLGIHDPDGQIDGNRDNEEDLGFDEQLLIESSKAMQPSTEGEKKSEMSISTKRVTDMAVRKFREFVKTKDLPGCFEQYSPEQLDSLLYEFYTDAKKKNGKKLKVSTLRTIRSSLDRYLKTESNKCLFTIAHSPIFQRSNKALDEAEATEIAERALDLFDESARVVKPLSADDIKILWESGVIGTNEPKALQRLVFVIIGINFGITTRDDVRQLKPSLFLFCTDTLRGLDFVQIDELQFCPSRAKRQKGKLDNKIFSIPSSPYCPVAALKLYLDKIHPRPQSFYLTPNPNFRKENIWYKREAVGKNTLGRFMRDISIDAHLPHQYVNSSLRITPPEVLSQGISAYRLSMSTSYYSCPIGVQTMQHTNTVVNENNDGTQEMFLVKNRIPSCTESTSDKITGTLTVSKTNTQALNKSNSDQTTPSFSHPWPTTVRAQSSTHISCTTTSPPVAFRNINNVSPGVPFVSTASSRFPISSSLSSVQRTCVPVQNCPVLCLPYDWELRDVVKVLRAGDAILLTSARSINNLQPASNSTQPQRPSFPQHSDGEKFKQALAAVNCKLSDLERRATLEPGTFNAILELRQLQKNLNSFATKAENGRL